MTQEKQEKPAKNQPQTQLSSQEVAELRKAVEQYKKNISKSAQEAIINKYKNKYPNDLFVASKLNEKARFDNPNMAKEKQEKPAVQERNPLDEFPLAKNAKNDLDRAYAILGFRLDALIMLSRILTRDEISDVYRKAIDKWNNILHGETSKDDKIYAKRVLTVLTDAANKVAENEEARQAKTQNQTDGQFIFQGRNLLDEFPGAKNAKRELDRAYVIFGFPQEEEDRSAITQSDVTKAYRKLSLKWHPDRWSSASADEREYATEVFKVINNAYEKLNKQQ